MTPITPIYNDAMVEHERILALDQPEYAPLVALRLIGPTYCADFTRWEFTEEERLMIAMGANLVVSNVCHPKSGFAPIALQVVAPNEPPSIEHLR